MVQSLRVILTKLQLRVIYVSTGASILCGNEAEIFIIPILWGKFVI